MTNTPRVLEVIEGYEQLIADYIARQQDPGMRRKGIMAINTGILSNCRDDGFSQGELVSLMNHFAVKVSCPEIGWTVLRH